MKPALRTLLPTLLLVGIVHADLVAHYEFTAGSELVDSSGTGNDLSLADIGTEIDFSGEFASFQGSEVADFDYLIAPNFGFDTAADAWTLQFDVRDPDGLGGPHPTAAGVISSHIDAGPDSWQLNSTEIAVGAIDEGSAGTGNDGGADGAIIGDLSDGGWHTILLVHEADATTVTAYFNGVLVDPTTLNWAAGRVTLKTMTLGTNRGENLQASVDLDNVMVWNTAEIPLSLSATRALIAAGETTELTVSFDPAADTATIVLPPGSVNGTDLKAVDAGDANPGDGIVTLTESPAADWTYIVDVTKTGESPLQASLNVEVFSFSEPADNAFSTEIKADSPLFYYRFEEPAAAGFLRDSSGNQWHAGAISGTLGQGSGSGPGGSAGGMGNAGQCPGDVQIVGPAQSPMDQSFTLCAVVNLNSVALGENQSILSMTDGSGTGRSLCFLSSTGVLTSYIAGATAADPSATVIADKTSCLIHMVYDASVPEIRYFVNGQPTGQVGVGAVDDNLGNWVLASGKVATAHLDGWLDESAVFETALSDTRIAAHGSAFFAAADPSLGFDADPMEVSSGGPVVLTWKTSDQATAVTLDGAPVDGATGGGIYTTSVNPTTTTTYTLVVSGPGGDVTREITVTVLAPPRITAISSDGSIPPNITLEFLGSPNITYDVQATANLTDGFPEFVTSVSTNGSGFGSVTFPGIGTREFYRLESP